VRVDPEPAAPPVVVAEPAPPVVDPDAPGPMVVVEPPAPPPASRTLPPHAARQAEMQNVNLEKTVVRIMATLLE
jgi:hypothetical protein